jgi:hypothetical protein
LLQTAFGKLSQLLGGSVFGPRLNRNVLFNELYIDELDIPQLMRDLQNTIDIQSSGLGQKRETSLIGAFVSATTSEVHKTPSQWARYSYQSQ